MHSHIAGVESRGLAAFEAAFAVFAAVVGVSLAAHSATSDPRDADGDHTLAAFLVLIAVCVISGVVAHLTEKKLRSHAPRSVVVRLSAEEYREALRRAGAEDEAHRDEALSKALRDQFLS